MTVSSWPMCIDERAARLDRRPGPPAANSTCSVRSSSLPRRDAAHVQQVVDQADQLGRAAARSRRRPALRLSGSPRAALSTAQRVADRVASGLRSSWASVARNSSLRRSASRSASVRSITRCSRVSFNSRSCSSARRRLGHLGKKCAVRQFNFPALSMEFRKYSDL